MWFMGQVLRSAAAEKRKARAKTPARALERPTFVRPRAERPEDPAKPDVRAVEESKEVVAAAFEDVEVAPEASNPLEQVELDGECQVIHPDGSKVRCTLNKAKGYRVKCKKKQTRSADGKTLVVEVDIYILEEGMLPIDPTGDLELTAKKEGWDADKKLAKLPENTIKVKTALTHRDTAEELIKRNLHRSLEDVDQEFRQAAQTGATQFVPHLVANPENRQEVETFVALACHNAFGGNFSGTVSYCQPCYGYGYADIVNPDGTWHSISMNNDPIFQAVGNFNSGGTAYSVPVYFHAGCGNPIRRSQNYSDGPRFVPYSAGGGSGGWAAGSSGTGGNGGGRSAGSSNGENGDGCGEQSSHSHGCYSNQYDKLVSDSISRLRSQYSNPARNLEKARSVIKADESAFKHTGTTFVPEKVDRSNQDQVAAALTVSYNRAFGKPVHGIKNIRETKVKGKVQECRPDGIHVDVELDGETVYEADIEVEDEVEKVITIVRVHYLNKNFNPIKVSEHKEIHFLDGRASVSGTDDEKSGKLFEERFISRCPKCNKEYQGRKPAKCSLCEKLYCECYMKVCCLCNKKICETCLYPAGTECKFCRLTICHNCIIRCKVKTCSKCTKQACPKCGFRCSNHDCEKEFCKSCSESESHDCAYCGSRFCGSCIAICEYCKYTECLKCQKQASDECRQCGKYGCKKCSEVCSTCKKNWICRGCSETARCKPCAKLVCSDCQRPCRKCDEERKCEKPAPMCDECKKKKEVASLESYLLPVTIRKLFATCCHQYYVYDLDSKQTTNLSATAGFMFNESSVIQVLNRVFITGGNMRNGAFEIDPNTFAITAKAPMFYSRMYHSQIAVTPNTFFAVGDINGTRTCEKYNIDENRWEKLPALTTRHHALALALMLNKDLYAISSYTISGNSIEKLNIAHLADGWTVVPIRPADLLL